MKNPASVKVIFIHHSTGANLIKHGDVRTLVHSSDPTVEFWDHGYDLDKIKGYHRIISRFQSHTYGLRNSAGQLLKTSFQIPDHNTDPDGLARLFSQPVEDPPTNAHSHIQRFDVISFKSCFPVTAIKDDQQLDTYKHYYLSIRTTIEAYPRKLFIPMTPPPLRAALTNTGQASRARRFARWIMSEEYHENRVNLVPYDFFDDLATPERHPNPNVLRPEFCRPIWLDSHPNRHANRVVARKWVAFIVDAIQKFGAPDKITVA